VLRTVRTGDSEVENAVPQLAVTVAFVLVVASVSALVWFIQHIVGVIRVDTMMTDVRAETAGVIDEIYPADQDRDDGSPDAGARAEDVLPPPVPSDAGSVLAPTSGFLLAVDTEALCSWAAEHGVVVAVDAEPGTWLLRGGPWARVWSEDPSAPLDDVAEHLRSRVAIGNERTTQQDARHGVSQLVDIAAKSLSPGINDPTTAVHAVGHLGDLLATLAGRRLGALIVRDEGEALRVVVARATFADYLELAFGQVRRYGAGEPAVVHAVLDVLAGLAGQVRGPERRDALRDQLSALAADARRSTPSAHDLSRVEEHVARVELLLIGALST
jgi:uncharacterized membrane protein